MDATKQFAEEMVTTARRWTNDAVLITMNGVVDLLESTEAAKVSPEAKLKVLGQSLRRMHAQAAKRCK